VTSPATLPALATVGATLSRDLSQNIEEVIKVEQANEAAVYAEITDYVATDRIKDHYRRLLHAIAETISEPHEGIGVWVSGFFGAGKSGFVKNLAYALENPTVKGSPAAELFKQQIKDSRIADLIDSVRSRAPMDAIMFDVRVHSKVLQGAGHITELMYTALLGALDYAEDYGIAELEIELEGEGKLDDFTHRCQETYSLDWRRVRNGAQKIPRASALLHALDPKTYPDADSWARTIQGRKTDLTIDAFVDRTFDLVVRRRPGRTVLFVLDEVGAYVARSADKIEDLRALTERFGQVGRNRVKAGEAVAPIWIVVTAQEKLEKVVAAIDSKRVELARLQDRFKFSVDLSPADIREVATKRVLAKKDEAIPELQRSYRDAEGQFNLALRLEHTSRKCNITSEDFVQFYPYPPHFVDLCIDIMSGIRLQPGAQTQVGGSNRTIIKQAYEMLVSQRTAVGEKPYGSLVTLDLVYELVEGLLRSERQLDIAAIRHQFEGHPDDSEGWTLRVAKVICLLEFVRDLPRTEANVAACLVDRVGTPAPTAQVQQAMQRLEEAQFIRNTDQGWKLQTAQEKNWETEKRGYLSPKPRERNEILREVLKELFSEPDLKTYRYLGRKNFKVGITVDATKVGDEGDIPLSLVVTDDTEAMKEKLTALRADSRQKTHENEVYWLFAMTPDVDGLINRLYASRQMVAKYDALRSQSRISPEEGAALQSERSQSQNLQNRLRDRLTAALEQGIGIFRGMDRDAASLGSRLGEILKRQFDYAVPDLYSKLEMGARALKGNEVEEVLKAANLSALPAVFYSSDTGLKLIIESGNRYVPNPSADVAKEVLDYIKREHAYGTKVTGRMLDEQFTGLGYGWERAVIQLVLAVLLRAGGIEVTHQGRRFRNYQEPQVREPFTNQTAFKAASFAPRATIDLKTLTTAVQRLEELTGEEVDIEEGAIAAAFQKLADEERQAVLPVIATAQAYRLPVQETLTEYRQTLDNILGSPSDDCVRILAGEGKSFRASRDQVRGIQGALDSSGLAILEAARQAVTQMAPALRQRSPTADAVATQAARLQERLRDETFYEFMDAIKSDTAALESAYWAEYERLHEKRSESYELAIDEVRGTEAWLLLDQAAEQAGRSERPEDEEAAKQAKAAARQELDELLAPLRSRDCSWVPLRAEGEAACDLCGATLGQMESDLAALTGLTEQVLQELRKRVAPSEPETPEIAPGVERVRLAEFFAADGSPLSDRPSVDEALERLRAFLYERVDAGVSVVPE
jgi:hypothetical protein